MEELRRFDACIFDAYGTLFDVSAAAKRYNTSIGDQWEELASIWRDKQLEYSWLRSLMGEYVSFWEITENALDYALSNLKINDPLLRKNLLALYFNLEAYSEVPETLEAFKKSGIKTAILSNGSPDMLTAAISNAGIKHLLDSVFSVDSVNIFKPHPKTYKLAYDGLCMNLDRIFFVSSNSWDAHGASNFGFNSYWVNRAKQGREFLPGEDIKEINNLLDLLPLINATY